MFRRFRSAILREPNVILMKLLYVCYVINAEQMKAEYGYLLCGGMLSVERSDRESFNFPN
jgi:hypothetical protein